MQEITERRTKESLIRDYEILEYRINHFFMGMPLREQVRITNLMDEIAECLREAHGMELNYFGKWE